MKLLLVSDIHFGVKSSVEGNSGNKKIGDLFLNKTFEVLDAMFAKHNEYIDAIAILGDVFDKRITSDNKVLYDTFKFFSRHIDKPIYILIGNHDCYFNNTNEYNTVNQLAMMFDNITIVPEETMVIDDILLVNWVNDENRDKIMSAIEKSTQSYLFGHFDIVGANLGSGRLSTKGFDKDEFKKFKQVFTGHYHTQSQISNIVYLGNPLQTKMSEHDEDKGVVILDTTTHSWYRDNYEMKMFYKVDYDSILDMVSAYGDVFYDTYIDKVVELTVDRSSSNYAIEKHERMVHNIRSVASSITVIIKNIVKVDDVSSKESVDISDGRTLLTDEMKKFNFSDNDKKYVDELYQQSKDELGE